MSHKVDEFEDSFDESQCNCNYGDEHEYVCEYRWANEDLRGDEPLTCHHMCEYCKDRADELVLLHADELFNIEDERRLGLARFSGLHVKVIDEMTNRERMMIGWFRYACGDVDAHEHTKVMEQVNREHTELFTPSLELLEYMALHVFLRKTMVNLRDPRVSISWKPRDEVEFICPSCDAPVDFSEWAEWQCPSCATTPHEGIVAREQEKRKNLFNQGTLRISGMFCIGVGDDVLSMAFTMTERQIHASTMRSGPTYLDGEDTFVASWEVWNTEVTRAHKGGFGAPLATMVHLLDNLSDEQIVDSIWNPRGVAMRPPEEGFRSWKTIGMSYEEYVDRGAIDE